VAKKWVSELRQKGSPGMVIALAGNKLDMVSRRATARLQFSATPAVWPRAPPLTPSPAPCSQAVKRNVQTEDVQAYATEQGLLFNEISAKQDIGVSHTAALNMPPPRRLLLLLLLQLRCNSARFLLAKDFLDATRLTVAARCRRRRRYRRAGWGSLPGRREGAAESGATDGQQQADHRWQAGGRRRSRWMLLIRSGQPTRSSTCWQWRAF
jgi:hypothetical protein